jgi:hypothetical protein
VFLSSVVFLASTDTGVKNGADELRKVFGAGTQLSSEGSGWVAQDLDEVKGAQGGEAAVTGVAESESGKIDSD